MNDNYICILLILAIIYVLYRNNKSIEKLSNLSSPSTPQTIIFQRYARYDPYHFPYPMDECFLGIHYDGSLIRARGNENWDSMRFELVPADMGHYYIKSVGLGSYLYINDNYIPTTQTPEELTARYKWEVTVDQLGNVIIWNPSTKRFLGLSCKDDVPYSRVDYHNDCLFKAILVQK